MFAQLPQKPVIKMANGEIDLALGFLPHLENGFYQQKLFEQYYVVIAPRIIHV